MCKYLFNSLLSILSEFQKWNYSDNSIGEGNGNPLQYSCLENPVDRGAWRAAVHGVAQSWTRLKQLSMIILYLIF